MKEQKSYLTAHIKKSPHKDNSEVDSIYMDMCDNACKDLYKALKTYLRLVYLRFKDEVEAEVSDAIL